MRRKPLRDHAESIAAGDVDWWLMTYYRAAMRIHDAQKKPNAARQARLWRHLQALHNEILAMLAAEKNAERRAQLAADAINRSITDNHLPGSWRITRTTGAPTAPDDPPDQAA
jgi:hypothetical protein